MAEAIEQLVSATVASLQASDVDHIGPASPRTNPAQPPGKATAGKRKENSAS
jgi:hypothetical protein